MKTLVCAAMLAAAAVAVVEAFPRPQGRVNDFAGVIDGTTAHELARLIRETDTLTSAEIAVVTVKSLDGMSIEEYAVRLFADWGIGRKGKDNGVLMLVAPAERRVRIEVGYGLEPIRLTRWPAASSAKSVCRRFAPTSSRAASCKASAGSPGSSSAAKPCRPASAPPRAPMTVHRRT